METVKVQRHQASNMHTEDAAAENTRCHPNTLDHFVTTCHLQVLAARRALDETGPGSHIVDDGALKPWHHEVGALGVHLARQVRKGCQCGAACIA